MAARASAEERETLQRMLVAQLIGLAIEVHEHVVAAHRYQHALAVSVYRENAMVRFRRVVERHRVAIGIVVAYLTGRALIFLSVGR